MHAVAFELKKAHLGMVDFGRRALAELPGMTPARFDLLFVVRRYRVPFMMTFGEHRAGVEQSTIRRVLGLHASTVAEMIDRLVELGWVTKMRCDWDRRTNIIELTEKGRALLFLAMKVVPRRKVHQRYLERFFARWRWSGEKRRVLHRATLENVWTFGYTVMALGESLGRKGRLEYPLRPWLYDGT